MLLPVKRPKPDIDGFKRTMLRKDKSRKVHFAELHIDNEVMKAILEGMLGRKWVEPSIDDKGQQAAAVKNYIHCWHRLGYDYFRFTAGFRGRGGLDFAARERLAGDTALLSKGERHWMEEGKGIISSWQDFEKYNWPRLEEIDFSSYEVAAEILPDGMGIFICGSPGVFEVPLNLLLGYENLCYLSYDNPELVKGVFARVGELIYGFYRNAVGLKGIAGFFQGEDMGFRTGTLMSPQFLTEHVLAWHRKIAGLAHEHGLLYMLHTCGNVEPIMEELIEDVRIDAKHSFEDEIISVGDFMKKYGGRVGVLGGVDVDKLCRLEEMELRKYVRGILDECMPAGGYALGTGNSVANYIPLANYLTMLDEGLRWQEENLRS